MTTTAPQLLPYLERLLDGETVEWKTLGEVCEYIRGITYNKAAETNDSDGWKVLRANNISLTTRTLNFNEVKRVKKTTKVSDKQKLYKGDILICAASGSKEHIGKTAYIESNTPYTFGGFMGVLRVKENTSISSRYLFHYLGSSIFTNHLSSALKSSTINNLNSGIISPFPIPLPPLRVQARIVEILDKFTQLETELENELAKELEMRNKQYDFYRNRLLFGPLPHSPNIPHQWEQVPLGSIGEVRMCKRILKQDTTETGEIPFYKIGTFGKSADAFISRTLFEEYKQKYTYPRIGDILISASGTIGRAIEFDGQDAYFQDSNIVWLEHNDSKVLNRFLYYCYQIADWKVSKGGTISRLYNDNIKKTLIPLPPLSEQRRIVEILDRFDTLTNSISEGLPREIALRRKQYEYYRDALLRFPPPAPTA